MVDSWAFVCVDRGGVIIIDIIVNGWVGSTAVDSYLFKDGIYKIGLGTGIGVGISASVSKGGRIDSVGLI